MLLAENSLYLKDYIFSQIYSRRKLFISKVFSEISSSAEKLQRLEFDVNEAKVLAQ